MVVFFSEHSFVFLGVIPARREGVPGKGEGYLPKTTELCSITLVFRREGNCFLEHPPHARHLGYSVPHVVNPHHMAKVPAQTLLDRQGGRGSESRSHGPEGTGCGSSWACLLGGRPQNFHPSPRWWTENSLAGASLPSALCSVGPGLPTQKPASQSRLPVQGGHPHGSFGVPSEGAAHVAVVAKP